MYVCIYIVFWILVAFQDCSFNSELGFCIFELSSRLCMARNTHFAGVILSAFRKEPQLGLLGDGDSLCADHGLDWVMKKGFIYTYRNEFLHPIR